MEALRLPDSCFALGPRRLRGVLPPESRVCAFLHLSPNAQLPPLEKAAQTFFFEPPMQVQRESTSMRAIRGKTHQSLAAWW